MESTVTCITWTNEFPKGVDAVRVSYPLIFFLLFIFFFVACLTKAHGFNDHHLGYISLVGSFFFLFLCAQKFVDAYMSCSYPGCVWPTTWRVCVCVCSAATNEDFYSGHSAQCVLSPQCDCAVNWPSPCWHCVRFTPTYSKQISDGDNLSGSIHQALAGSALVRPSPVSPAETYSSLPIGNECIETRRLIRRGLFNLCVSLLPNKFTATLNQTKDKASRRMYRINLNVSMKITVRTEKSGLQNIAALQFRLSNQYLVK